MKWGQKHSQLPPSHSSKVVLGMLSLVGRRYCQSYFQLQTSKLLQEQGPCHVARNSGLLVASRSCLRERGAAQWSALHSKTLQYMFFRRQPLLQHAFSQTMQARNPDRERQSDRETERERERERETQRSALGGGQTRGGSRDSTKSSSVCCVSLFHHASMRDAQGLPAQPKECFPLLPEKIPDPPPTHLYGENIGKNNLGGEYVVSRDSGDPFPDIPQMGHRTRPKGRVPRYKLLSSLPNLRVWEAPCLSNLVRERAGDEIEMGMSAARLGSDHWEIEFRTFPNESQIDNGNLSCTLMGVHKG